MVQTWPKYDIKSDSSKYISWTIAKKYQNTQIWPFSDVPAMTFKAIQ